MSDASSSPTRAQTFAAMSAVLTGFQAAIISPTLDPIDLNGLYLQTADAQTGTSLVDQLLQQFTSLQGQPKQVIADTLLASDNPNPPPPPNTAWLARSIAKLWYVGSWYPAAPPPAGGPPGIGTVASANAYIGGLMWKAAQAHPMGYSAFTFGYWNTAPPSLEQFGVDIPSGGGSNG
jgi:hypothetical protein